MLVKYIIDFFKFINEINCLADLDSYGPMWDYSKLEIIERSNE